MVSGVRIVRYVFGRPNVTDYEFFSMAALYTRSGDDGSTGLFGGHRVSKDDPRVKAYGTVDELNAALGVAAAACDPSDDFDKRILGLLLRLQSTLFDLGADLATPEDSPHAGKISRITPAEVHEAESWIDEFDGENDPLTSFILPGGCEVAARLHLARAICRRAERHLVTAGRTESLHPHALVYINRVSDLLFALARRANKEAGVDDVPWVPRATVETD